MSEVERLSGMLYKQLRLLSWALGLVFAPLWLIFAQAEWSRAYAANDIVKEGLIDLTGKFDQGPFILHGEWMFFPQVLLSPEGFVSLWQKNPQSFQYAKTSQSFKQVDPKRFQSNLSFASYAIILKGLPPETLGLTGADVYTAAHIMLFPLSDPSRLIALDVGKTSMIPEKSEPAILMEEILPFRPTAVEDYVLIIQISNFHHEWGGLWIPPSIGLYKAIAESLKSTDRMSYWIIGMIAFLSVYNIALFYRRPEDKSSLYLSIFSVILALRLFILANYGAKFFDYQEWNFELQLKVVYISMLMLPSVFMLFLQSCFPERLSLRTTWLCLIISIIPSLFVLFAPVLIYTKFLEPLRLVGFGIGIFGFSTYFKAVRARDEGAFTSCIGSSAVMVGWIFDTLNSYGFRYFPSNCTGVGMSFFVLCQSQIVALRFARAFRQSEYLGRELQTEVQRQTRDIKSILTSIHQGIFTINKTSRTIDEQHSDYMKVITGEKKIEGHTIRSLFLDRSSLNEDQKSLTEATLDASLGEDILGFEVNSANLVRELEYRAPGVDARKIIELDWNPVLDADNTVAKILVSARDVSDIRSLEIQAQEQERDLKIILDLIRIPEDRFQRFMEKTKEYVKENRQLIMQHKQGQAELVKRLFVNMHTVKGAARTYSLTAISAASHDVEQRYARIQKDLAQWDQEALLEDLKKVEEAVEHCQTLAAERLGWRLEDKAVKLSRREIEHTLELLTKIEELPTMGNTNSLSEAKRILLQHCYSDLPEVVEEATQGIDSMARDLGKAMPLIDLQSLPVVMKDRGVDLLTSLLTHLFRNSLDHGLETPELRQKKGKPPRGTIHIHTKIAENFLLFVYSDDGNGLNLIKLEKLGHQLDLLPKNQPLTDQMIAELVFCSGLSTKDEVSDISGRGVGLDAVKSYLEDNGGDIHLRLETVKDREHVPFLFEIRLPLDFCFTGSIVAGTEDATAWKREA